MGYVINLTSRAQRDLALLFDLIDAESSHRALIWYRGLKEAILSLQEHPNRCQKTPEDPRLRHLLYGHQPHVHRVVYRVNAKHKRGDVLHIRHGARQRFNRSEVK
jgi:plasmid stabilization system protein ParE